MDKVKEIVTSRDSSKAEMEALKRILVNMDTVVGELANLRRKSYLAHVEAGFTKEEALILCNKLMVD